MDLQQRQKSCDVLKRAFGTAPSPSTNLQNIVKALEEAVFVLHRSPTEEDLQRYRSHIFSLYSNIKQNSELRKQLLNETISVTEVAQMPAEDLRTRMQKRSDENILESLIHQEIVADREIIPARPSPSERENEGDLY